MKGDHYLYVITIIDNYNFHHHTKGKLGSVPEELKSEYDNLFFSCKLKRKRGNKSCHSWLKTKDYANETKNNRKYNKVISEYRHHLPSLFHLKYTHNFFQIYYVWLVVIYLHVFFFHLSIKDSTGGKSNELRCDRQTQGLTFFSCGSGRATCSKLCCNSNRCCTFLNIYPVIMTLYMSCARFSAT